MNRWIKLHQKLRYSEVYKDKNAKIVLLHIFLCADMDGKCVVSRYTTSKELGLKPSTFRDALRRLQDFKITTLKTTRDTTTVYLNKWEDYQQPTRQASRQGDLQNTTLIIDNRIKNKELNTKEITKSNSQNNFVEGVQQKFGNQFTNIGLEIFEETFGFKPIDLKPRNEAYTFYRSVQALLKRYNINITEAPERYKKLLTGYFTWLSDDDIGAGIQTMSGARRHFRKYEPKIINILERKNGLQEKTN